MQFWGDKCHKKRNDGNDLFSKHVLTSFNKKSLEENQQSSYKCWSWLAVALAAWTECFVFVLGITQDPIHSVPAWAQFDPVV